MRKHSWARELGRTDRSWQPAIAPEELTQGVHDNLRNPGLEALDVVNYRVIGSGLGPEE